MPLQKKMNFSDEIIDAISVDCVVFGFKHGILYALLVKHGQGVTKGEWALPGSWVKYNEDIEASAYRILKAQTSVTKIYLEQFQTFGEVNRYPSKRVITISYYALVNTEDIELHAGVTVSDAQWFDVRKLPKMAFDHRKILDKCFTFLKHKIQHEPIGFNLLPEKFTLLDLQELYEAILGKQLDKSNFRRKLAKMNLLVPRNEIQQNVAHRAAKLFRFDKKVYDKLTEKGFSFEL